MTPRRFLVLSYFHPPFPGSGGTRWLAMARHLRELGHEVTLVATDAFGTRRDDAAQGVVRAADLAASPALRRLLRRPPAAPAAGGPVRLDTPAPAVLTRVLVPDSYAVSWVPAALATVRRLLRERRYDCLVTSSPPDSAHLVGLALGRRRPAWIADLRDGWLFEPLRAPFPTAPQRALDRWLEGRVARTADVAVGATGPIAEDLGRRLGARAAWVPNGWDPALAPAAAEAEPAAEGGPPTLLHTGTLSGAWGRDPRPLFAALRRVLDESDADAPPPLHLRLVGRLLEEEAAAIRAAGVERLVEHTGSVERAEALAMQRRADALLLLTSRNSSEATSKLFEYLAAGRPIVALAHGNEAARIVERTRTGVTVDPGDVEGIATALRGVVSGELAAAYAPRDLGRFTYPGPAEALAELAEEAIARRQTVIASA